MSENVTYEKNMTYEKWKQLYDITHASKVFDVMDLPNAPHTLSIN